MSPPSNPKAQAVNVKYVKHSFDNCIYLHIKVNAPTAGSYPTVTLSSVRTAMCRTAVCLFVACVESGCCSAEGDLYSLMWALTGTGAFWCGH